MNILRFRGRVKKPAKSKCHKNSFRGQLWYQNAPKKTNKILINYYKLYLEQ